MHSILADKTKDNSKEEQLDIVIEFVDLDTATQQERFLLMLKLVVLMLRGYYPIFSLNHMIMV